MSPWTVLIGTLALRPSAPLKQSAARRQEQRAYCRRNKSQQDTRAQLLRALSADDWRKTAAVAKAAKKSATATLALLRQLEDKGAVISKRDSYLREWRLAA